MKESTVLWFAVAGGAGFLAWKAYQDHQAAEAAGILPLPLVTPPVNLMAPGSSIANSGYAAAVAPTPTSTPAPPAAAPIIEPPINLMTPAQSNAAFTSSMAEAHAQQDAYYDAQRDALLAALAQGRLTPGTADYRLAVENVANRRGVDGRAEELAKLATLGVTL